ncbi:MAG: hypothetical protein AMS22_09845 [Thiotrichales bacterium SG8_50]|nr:MAG: hypothetical protein AMS22_09845 [Thiotrichales bacterium SG8_50]
MNELNELYWSLATLACYDGDGDGDGNGDGDGDGTGLGDFATAARRAAEEAAKEAERKAAEARQKKQEADDAVSLKFTQDDLNRFLAEDRRKHQDKLKKLESGYKEILADKNLALEQRQKLEAELEDLRKSQMTEKQRLEYERKQQAEKFKSDLGQLKESASRWETLYKGSQIDRSLQDAAIAAEAFNPNQIVGLLRPMTKMQERTDEAGNGLGDFTPVIDFPDIDEATGEQVMTLRTPEEAVQRMKELPNLFGNLFKSNVVSGVGSGSATGGVTSGDGGRVDPAKLTPEQFRKLRKENPEALGLRKRR